MRGSGAPTPPAIPPLNLSQQNEKIGQILTSGRKSAAFPTNLVRDANETDQLFASRRGPILPTNRREREDAFNAWARAGQVGH